jgi:hypothetical protein
VFLSDNGTKCASKKHEPLDKNSAACANGICTSRDIQCRAASNLKNAIVGACLRYTTSCRMVCTDGKECLLMNLNFLDGTQCGKGGICHDGKCVGSSLSAYAADYTEVLIIVILMVIMCLLALFVVLLKHREPENEQENEQEPR